MEHTPMDNTFTGEEKGHVAETVKGPSSLILLNKSWFCYGERRDEG